jgi:hypothetical protein
MKVVACLEALPEHVEVEPPVGPELLHELRVLQERDERGGRRLEGLEPLDDILAARSHVVGDVVGAVERLVDVHSVADPDHDCAIDEAELSLQDLRFRVQPPLLQELQQR